MCENIELEFERMGISWKVEVIQDDQMIDTVVSVSVWDGKKYVEVETDTAQFEADMEDILNEEIESFYLNLRLQHEDMMYEKAREEGRI